MKNARMRNTFILQDRSGQGGAAREIPDQRSIKMSTRFEMISIPSLSLSLADSRSRIHASFHITRAISAVVELYAFSLFLLRSLFYDLFSSIGAIVFDRCRIILSNRCFSCSMFCEVSLLRLLLAEFARTQLCIRSYFRD